VWSENEIFDFDNFKRIIENITTLRGAFFVYKNTPLTPMPRYRWQDINAIEKILNDLDVMINDVKSNYRYCGEFECGELI
jgi:hypothetical protein